MNEHQDELHDLLTLWVESMHRSDIATGYNGRASGGMLSGGAKDPDQLYGHNDRVRAKAVEAAVDSLRIQERSAIFKAYGLARVWRFAKLDEMELLETARAQLRLILKKKNLLTPKYCSIMRADGTLHVCSKCNFA